MKSNIYNIISLYLVIFINILFITHIICFSFVYEYDDHKSYKRKNSCVILY